MNRIESEPAIKAASGLGRRPRHMATIVALLILIFVAVSLSAVRQKSPTADETFHLASGYSYLKWADFRLNPEHPPLAKLIAALPLLALNNDDTPLTREQRDTVQVNGVNGWRLANQWLFSRNDAESMLFYARLSMLLVAGLLGLLVFAWTRELYGLSAAFAALVLYVFDPNMLAYAPLIHTDIPFALTLFGGTYFFWRTLREITWLNCLTTVVFFSAAAITKFSFIIVPPIWGVLAIARVVSSEPLHSRITAQSSFVGAWTKSGWVAIICISAALCTYGTIWAAYGFRYDAVSGQQTPLGISSAITPAWWLTPLIHLNQNSHVFPEAWLSGLVYAISSLGRTSYLLGEISADGFWYYFPIAIAVKTPLPTLLLLITSLTMVNANRRAWVNSLFLWVPIFLFFSVAIYSRMNIGVRHILPIYPFLFVWLGGFSTALLRSSAIAKRCGLLLMGIWLISSCLSNYPDYIAFFNETLGHRERHEILVDSSLDWGQDLKGLNRWMVDQQVDRIELAYFGTADPAYYGIDAIYEPGTWSIVFSQPQNQAGVQKASYIAISVTHLMGLYLGPANPYAPFLRKTPVASIGHSIMVYRTEQ